MTPKVFSLRKREDAAINNRNGGYVARGTDRELSWRHTVS